ncbi:MAG: hypothetical protein H7A05_03405 [Pseudomonadales bacterium]|nr:hypothetical protein [Pseudomonadales bacterium]
MKELTDKQLKELIRIVKNHPNINARWAALSNDPINQEIKFTRADFLSTYGLKKKSVEGRIREHIQTNQNVDVGALRNELNEVDEIAQFQRSLARENSKTDILLGSTAFFVALGIIVALGFLMYGAGESDLEETVTESDVRSSLDRCMEASRFERSCQTDPEFTYCSIAFENQIGSGCTSRIRAIGGPVEQGQFCITQLTPIIRQQCAIEIYGCAAVTGNDNC